MNLADLIDLDCQLQRRDAEPEDSVRAQLERDRRIGRDLGARSASDADEALLSAWTRNVSADEDRSLGLLVAGAIRWTAFLLALFGFLAGASAAAALLHYDGTQPINVLFFLGTIVGFQLLLLPLLILGLVFRRRFLWAGRMGRGLVGGLLMQTLVLLTRLGVAPEQTAKIRADLGKLRRTNSLFSRVQPLLIGGLIQVFGVAFNLAVAGTLFVLVMFSDLSFSWGTTMQVEAAQVQRLTAVISAPWAGVWPEARPSLELVEATRFSRMEGAFAGSEAGAARRAGGWWPFLLASTITYGLLPRVIAFIASMCLLRIEIRRALARSAAVRDLKERLATPLVTIGGLHAEKPVAENFGRTNGRGAGIVQKGLDLAVVSWAYDEAPPEPIVGRILEQRVGARIIRRFEAGGLEESDAGVLEELKQLKDEGKIEGIAVFFEPFEPPKADVRRFLTRLREDLGPSAPIVIFLLELAGGEIAPLEEEDWTAWDRAIAAIGDPFTLLEEKRAL